MVDELNRLQIGPGDLVVDGDVGQCVADLIGVQAGLHAGDGQTGLAAAAVVQPKLFQHTGHTGVGGDQGAERWIGGQIVELRDGRIAHCCSSWNG